MTLCSHFRTDAPVNPQAIHDFATALVNDKGIEVPTVPHDESRWGPRPNQIWNRSAGLKALIWTEFGEDGPLQVNGSDVPYTYDDGTVDDYEEEFEPAPKAMVDVSMDTGYGFNEDGMGCTELHAGLFLALDKYVRDQFPNAKNYWYNEYAGSWHTFDDDDGWFQFVGDGVAARSWFQNTVLPLIKEKGLDNLIQGW